MKTKLEELRAAYEAATPGEWERLSTCGGMHVCTISENGCDVTSVCDVFKNDDVGEFIALAHNLMPQLLEAVDLLKKVSTARAHQDHEFDVDAWYVEVRATLEALK